MNIATNIPRIYAAMKAKGWGIRDTCVNCKVNCKTLRGILDGGIPRRIDALYRLCDGLEISIEEALNGGTPVEEARPRIVLPSRGRVLSIVKNQEQGRG